MKKNMGTTDRVIRILIAVTIIVLVISHVIAGIWSFVLTAFAIIFLLTSLVGVCPLYSLLGFTSHREKKA